MKFNQSLNEFFTSKTNWTGLTMIITGIVGGYTKSMDPVQAIQTSMGGFGLIAVKDAVVKV